MAPSLSIAVPLALLLVSLVWPDQWLRTAQWLLAIAVLLAMADAGLARAYARLNRVKTAPATPRLALVTGASAGLGKEMASLLAKRGYALLLVARREALLRTLQQELAPLTTGTVTYCVADLATAEGVRGVVEFVRANKLKVDVLINNAGASVRGELTALAVDQVESLVQLNVAAATTLTRTLVPAMVARRRGGHVLFISSMGGEIPNPKAAIYAASKAFLTSFAQAVNHELRGTGVKVTAFLPGPLHTEFGQHAQCQDAIYMNLPGRATVAECAVAALAAMDDPACAVAFDKWTTGLMTAVMTRVLPRNVSVTLTGLTMEDPATLLRKVPGLRSSNLNVT